MGASSGRRLVVHALFLVSGATALVYEITWMGWLGQVFGNTAQAAAATLTAFFLGLGLGAAALGRLAPLLRRPLRVYGWLEVGVCATGLLGWLLVRDRIGLHVSTTDVIGEDRWQLALERLGVAIFWMGPTAFCLGGTFPVLCEALVERREELGRRGTLLYAVNTLGAALGALLATFVLVPRLGYRQTYVTALVSAALVGVLAWWIGRRPREPRPLTPRQPGLQRTGVWSLAIASGLLALALQVLWTRMFAQALPGSVYVFGTVVVVFLLGLALAGGLAHGLARRGASRTTLSVLLGLAGVAVAATVPLFLLQTDGLRPPSPGQAWGAYLRGVVVDAVIVLLPAVLLLGTVFPYLLKVAEARARAVGRTVGGLAAANTLGAIAGALLAGFVLLEVAGLWTSIRLVAVVYAGLAVLVATRPGPQLVGVACLALCGASFLLSAPVVRVDAGEELLQVWEGPSGTVAVLERDGERKLVLDNVFTLGGSHDARWEALQTHIPLCLHPHPRRVLYLGMGTGITAAAALEHPVERVVVAEIVPAVVEAARTWFEEDAGSLFTDERVEIVATDARRLLRASDERYDVVVGDLFFPWSEGTANLYAREHFQLVKDHLVEGGMFAQWLPCYQMSHAEVAGVMRTFAQVFGHVHVWRGDFFADRPLLALVGGTSARVDASDLLEERARTLTGGTGDDLARGAHPLARHLYVGSVPDARGTHEPRLDVLDDARVITLDLPWLAWSAPRSERAHEGEDRVGLLVGERLLAFEKRFLHERLDRLVEAGWVMRRMAVALHLHRRSEHARALLDYVRLVPAKSRVDLERWIE